MDRHKIRRVRSGIEDEYAWVSIWFRTDARNLEVLHISCAKTDRHPVTGHLYLERDDQAIACYGGATKVVLGADGIDLHLNNKGMKSLMLEGIVCLVVPEKLSGWKKAFCVFQEMATYPAGGVIKLG